MFTHFDSVENIGSAKSYFGYELFSKVEEKFDMTQYDPVG